MSSTHAVRGQANLHDSFESNSSNTSSKRKRADVYRSRAHTPSFSLNMQQPPPPAHDTSDRHAHTLEAAEDVEAAALLNHMHLMHHDVDRPARPSEADLMHVNYHENGNAGVGHHRPAADHQMLHPLAPRQHAREDSSSSDASATNYFSGDSDLTAEPIMGCATDEDGAKSSNSGSGTPFKVPRRASPSASHAQALAAGVGEDYSINISPQHVGNTGNDREEAPQNLPYTTVVQPSTSTTSTSVCKISPDSKLLATSQAMQHTRAIRTLGGGGCDRSQVGGDSGKGSESWLELRLGFSAELQLKAGQDSDANISPRDERRKGGESTLDGTMESTPVTLQLLPSDSPATEVNAGAGGGLVREGIASRSCLYGDLPPVYHPAAASFSHARPRFDQNHHTIATFVPPDRPQISLDQNKTPVGAAFQTADHQRFLMNQDNDPAAGLQQTTHYSALTAGAGYDQARGYAHGDDQRRWLAAETSEMMMLSAPSMIAAARPAEIYRPTASLGWSNRTSADTRSWSGNAYAPPAHLQRTMSWQGLLRSMTTDPLLHPLPDLPLCSFDTGPPELAAARRRHMFPAATANQPPRSYPMRTQHQRLQLSTSRRISAGLWFSLQEAHPYSSEHVEDEEEHHSSMQKVYLRIRDGKMQISVLQSYLLRKLESLGSYDSHEVQITCRGKPLSPTLTIQHVRDTIWLSKDVDCNEAIGFRYTNKYPNESHDKIMALCYQRHHSQTVTLNLLKT